MGLLDRVSAWRDSRVAVPVNHRTKVALPELVAARRPGNRSRVGVLVYQGLTTAEIGEPVRLLAEGMDADVIHIGPPSSAQSVVGVEPFRKVKIDVTTEDKLAMSCNVLVIPGGLGWAQVAEDAAVIEWVVKAAQSADGILAVSTGSLILAAAGQLAGEAATGHWLGREALSALGADVQSDRVAHANDERIVTASGVQAALGAASALAQRIRWGI